MGGSERAQHQPSRHEHEEDSGDSEKPGQVQAHTAAEDPDPDTHGNRNTDDGPRAGTKNAGRRLEGSEQKHGGLEALLEYRQERHSGKCPRRSIAERGRRVLLQLGAHVSGVPVHPADHRRDRGHRDHADY